MHIDVQKVFFLYLREILRTPDGGIFALDWQNRHNAKTKTIVLVIPGILSSSETNYVTHYVEIARKKKCIVVVQNYRGIHCDLLTPRFYSGSSYEDLDLTVEHVKNLYPEHKIFAVGISNGAVKWN
jgi:predicted alpha/beta-fold hydrolase